MDGWRRRYSRRLNLMDNVATNLRIPRWDHSRPWLTVQPTPVADVVIHRSPRYHGRAFPWSEVLGRWGDRTVMVGSPAEHEAFTTEFGDVRHCETATALDLAGVIAGAKLYVGNQSAPLSLAHGLTVPVWVELDKDIKNTIHNRPHAWYGVKDIEKVAKCLETAR